MVELGGTFEPGFERVHDLLAANIGAGKELGASPGLNDLAER